MKNVHELKKLREQKKLTSSNFEKIYNRILDSMCNYNTTTEILDIPVTKADIDVLQGLQFKVELVKTHGIMGRSEKYIISWE